MQRSPQEQEALNNAHKAMASELNKDIIEVFKKYQAMQADPLYMATVFSQWMWLMLSTAVVNRLTDRRGIRKWLEMHRKVGFKSLTKFLENNKI